MHAVIKATGISTDITITSSLEHAAIAARNCIQSAGIDVQEVNYLFNVGIYRDQNMVEPSMAALIQKRIGLNLDFLRFPVNSTAFSTDLMNGAAGAINALHVTDALFKNGRPGYVLVVSSDTHPSENPVEGFPITPCGAAFLLAPGNGEKGFTHFSFKTSPGDYIGESSYVDFENHGINGRNVIAIDHATDFHQRALDFAAVTARDFLEQHDINPATVALVSSAFNATFATDLATRLAISSVINVWEKQGNPHTSAFGIGYHALLARGVPTSCEHILFVGAGAGLTANCALYTL